MLLAGLNGLAGILLLSLAFFASLFIGVAHSIAGALWLFTMFGVMVIAFLAIVGIASLLIAWGLYTGKRWAWWLSLIVSGIGVITSICTLSIFSLLIDAIIIVYLLKLTVQLHFSVDFPWSW